MPYESSSPVAVLVLPRSVVAAMRVFISANPAGLDTSGLGEDVYGGGIGFDSYLFKRGDYAYALHVTWFNGTDCPLDALRLARTMDRRAQQAAQ